MTRAAAAARRSCDWPIPERDHWAIPADTSLQTKDSIDIGSTRQKSKLFNCPSFLKITGPILFVVVKFRTI